jgi:S-DNA-T family DNA segregation ATPase FtsK/SpoIIIE
MILQLAMKAQSIRILAPIPGKSAVWDRIAKFKETASFFSEIVASDDFKIAKGYLPFAIGQDCFRQSFSQ